MQRHNDAPVEMLMARLAPQAQLPEATAQEAAVLPILFRQAQAQGPVGITDSEMGENIVPVETQAVQKGSGRGRFHEPLVIIGRDLLKQQAVVGLRIQRTRQTPDCASFAAPARGNHRRLARGQEFASVAQADAIVGL